ncbi:MAG: preprotein translocase subunit SecE [Candidatus Paceibacterota bacterium]|jgi:preprotein translocase subunit SecE
MSILKYFKDTKTEMKHVTWPTMRQAVIYTIIVIVAAISVSLVLGLFDYLFSLGIQKII